MHPIIAVEAVLRLALDLRIDTRVLRLVHGLSPRIAELQAQHRGRDAYIALGTVLELTGIGSQMTIPAAVERQHEQVGALERTWNGRPGGFVITDAGKVKGYGIASRWKLTGREYEGVPLRWSTGEEVVGMDRQRVERLLSPGSEAMRSSDVGYRVVLATIARRGVGDVPLTSKDLQEWGWSRSAAYRAIAEVRRLCWYFDGHLQVSTMLLGDPSHARPPLVKHRLRVRAWIERLVDAQVAWTERYQEKVVAWLSKWGRPFVVPEQVRLDIMASRGLALRT